MSHAAQAESALVFACAGERLVGVLSRPPRPARAGIVIVVGGPQYRVGSHRQFLLLARELARAGFAVMRFDCRGMGDSDGQARSFEDLDDDIAAAIDAFTQACPEVTSVALWGLCDAASAALLYCRRRHDARVHGLCLLNPWVRSEHTLARARLRHYYGERLGQPDFWRRLWRGETRLKGALADLWHNWKLARAARSAAAADATGFQALMAAGFREFAGEVLLILSGRDATAQEFLECVRSDPAWAGLLGRPHLLRLELSDADHTFSNPLARQAVEGATRDWLARLAAQRGAA